VTLRPYYERGGVVLYHGDCRDLIEEWFPDFAGEPFRVGLVVTDPPYASGARRDADRQVRGAMLRSMEDADWFSHDAMTSWGFTWFLRSVFTALREWLEPGAHSYVFTDWRQTPNVYGLLEACSFRVNHCMVWDKEHIGMGTPVRNQHENIVSASNGSPAEMLDKGLPSVLRCPAVSPAARVHPTEKPVALLRRLIDATPGALVFDPFAGSGSTLRAAALCGRPSIGCEMREDYCEIAARALDATLDGVRPEERAQGQAGLFGGAA
jgi:site-specific DNA-methyltransferase (adenine-specific)